MIIDLPSTTTAAVNRKLVDLRDSGGAIALGRVLTLVIVTDEPGAEEAIEAANDASREHPCRVIVIVQGNRRGSERIDAQVRVGGDAGASEVIVLRLYGQLTAHADSVLTPLLLPDSPLVAWWPGQAPTNPSQDPIGAMAQRRITDAAASPTPRKELQRRRDTYAVGDTDLAWTRLTKWRGLLAAALDQPPYEQVEHITVTGASDSPSTDLLAAWLAESLRCPVTRGRTTAGSGMAGVRLQRRSGPIDLMRSDGAIATLTQPGQPDRRIALPRRDMAECLAEELRRLDPDEIYQATLSKGLARVDAGRSVTATQAAAEGEAMSIKQARRDSRTAERREAATARAIREAAPGGTPAKKATAAKKADREEGDGSQEDRSQEDRSQEDRSQEAVLVSASPLVVVHRDADVLAASVAARLVTRLVDAQASRGSAHVVLTGGTMGIAALSALAANPARDAVAWSRVHVWWGDERYLRAGDPERNETQAREALLDALPLDPSRVHAMPASDDPRAGDVDGAAAWYAEELARVARSEGSSRDEVPAFDVLMLGVGPDAHVASLFPEMAAVHERERTVVGVHGSPKPPPLRVSLTLPAISRAEEVWLVASGEGKAGAVGLALSGAGPVQAPAGAVAGRRATVWLLDRAAAAQVPPALIRIASP